MISSVVARERSEAPVGYAAAKGAVLTLCRYLSSAWADDGIRVNAVLPGNVYSPGGRWAEIMAGDEDGTKEYIRLEVPMKRFGTAEDVADCVASLLSGAFSYMTGQIIVLDGGLSL